MIENGSILELSNNKKYIITDSSLENCNIYYLSLEVDFDTEIPKDDTIFFKHTDNNTLTPVTNESDVEFLKTVFLNKFISNYMLDDE